MAVAVFGISISMLGIAIIQANEATGCVNPYVIQGVMTSFVGIVIATAAVLKAYSPR